MYELKSARYVAAEVFRAVLEKGDRVIDATMGNGHDTETLCRLVGEEGRVYAFDIQEAAVASTRERLEAAGLLDRAELFHMGHERMGEMVSRRVKLIAFNLGWLPGGDHRVTTRAETTLNAIRQAMELLEPMGVLVICVYPGHPEGEREREAVSEMLRGLSPREYNVLAHEFLNAGPGAPVCLVVQRQRGPEKDREK